MSKATRIGIDTNILIRFLTGDDKRQARLAHKAIAGSANNHQCYINIITLCETLWVLRTRFAYPSSALANGLQLLLSSPDFVMEDAELLHQALNVPAKTGLVDLLIGLRNRKAGCATTLTFDKNAATLDTFTLLA